MDLDMLMFDMLDRYPGMQDQDIIKLLYQDHLGCGHLVSDYDTALKRLREEAASVVPDAEGRPVEYLSHGYDRVHLAPYLARGGSLETLAHLFQLSAKPETEEGKRALISELREWMGRGLLDEAGTKAYIAAGCPSVHHSEEYRRQYAPAYRIVASELTELLELFIRIDRLRREKPNAVIAVDGPCGSGKSTLAELLSTVTGARVLHMDDFFLRPEQRTPERYALPGENVDHERFAEEVLLPLKNGEPFRYRPFDCRTMTVSEGETCSPEGLWIVEGSYSLHEQLTPYYDMKILLKISPEKQRALLLKREGEERFAMFEKRWIPLEERYFIWNNPESRSDVVVEVRPQDDSHFHHLLRFGGNQ